METRTPENRPAAPGELRLVQEFLNSGHLNVADWLAPEVAEAVRLRAGAGENRGTLAREYRLGRSMVSALARGSPIYDELRPAAAASEWLESRGLLTPGTPISETEVERLVEFRELLRVMATANNHGPLGPETVKALDAITGSVPLALTFGASAEPVLRPLSAGVDAAIGRLLAVIFDAVRDDSWQRLKRCPGTGCPFTFYDTSRNRTGMWCSMSVCGNRTKVRNYQARRRTGQ